MRVNTFKSVICCIVMGICCSKVFALNLLGPPTAELSKGQFEFTLEHSHSRFALDFDYTGGSGVMADFKRSRMKMDNIAGRIGYGINDNIEGFAYLGWAQVINSESSSRLDADGSLYGLGAKFTFLEYYLVKWGAQIQANLTKTDGSWSRPNWTGDVDVDFMQIILAGGINYELTRYASMYGGPFCYYLSGEKEYVEISPIPGWFEKYDFKNRTNIGFYVGLQMDVPTDAKLNFEYQKTAHDNMLSLGLAWRY